MRENNIAIILLSCGFNCATLWSHSFWTESLENLKILKLRTRPTSTRPKNVANVRDFFYDQKTATKVKTFKPSNSEQRLNLFVHRKKSFHFFQLRLFFIRRLDCKLIIIIIYYGTFAVVFSAFHSKRKQSKNVFSSTVLIHQTSLHVVVLWINW